LLEPGKSRKGLRARRRQTQRHNSSLSEFRGDHGPVKDIEHLTFEVNSNFTSDFATRDQVIQNARHVQTAVQVLLALIFQSCLQLPQSGDPKMGSACFCLVVVLKNNSGLCLQIMMMPTYTRGNKQHMQRPHATNTCGLHLE
jgi:hypothetical protein